jgi:hypothetical protein
MRITIEMTEAESRSTVIGRDDADAARAQSVSEAAPTDGGPPPATLRLALDAQGEEEVREEETAEHGTRAGGPPDWLREVIDGGAAVS